ncbi:ABC transporter ATP-binding protein [Paenibacillus sp. JX-17]|uniref:ABC transporter ATP-binding protein n=1 Tax=Paenibacillus lacisoli TaxID=3064525 RepID=A0ABT9CDJ5_9BACL|nr:ABC transporter ATP-binding protein [Paenibacillus sp. JX-17]MDO7907334.1 ABC transporter ATP-binding protein [Paenibacillus sp. JX-17]
MNRDEDLSAAPLLEARQLSQTYGDTYALQQLDWSIREGEWWGIIGPNGSGKSTLIKFLSGVESPTSGEVLLGGRSITAYSRRELSRRIAVLQQDAIPPAGYTVREVIEMGRYPYQNWLGRERSDERRVGQLINDIMERLGLAELGQRKLDELSGGQRQRVALAKVMAQEPSILLLDEPTTFLDVHYQMQLMDLLAQWRQEQGITIAAVLHDLNLAALFCDRLLLLKEGQFRGNGTPREMLTPDQISDVFRIQPAIIEHPDDGIPQLLLRRQVSDSQIETDKEVES